MLLVDKAMRPTSGHVVLAVMDNEFTGKTYWERAGRLRLKASDPTYPDIARRLTLFQSKKPDSKNQKRLHHF